MPAETSLAATTIATGTARSPDPLMDIAREQRHAATMDIASHAVAWQSPSSEGSGAVGLPRRPPWVDSSQLPHIFWTLREASGDVAISQLRVAGGREVATPLRGSQSPTSLAISRMGRTLRGASSDAFASSGCCEARQPRSNPPAPVRLNQRTLREASGDLRRPAIR
jgi:hypothetical protein